MKYLVIEVQNFGSGISTPTYAYDSENSANAKYHQILASAAISSLPVHSAIMFTDEGFFLRGECFKHEPEEE